MNKLVVSTLESKFLIFDLRTQHLTQGFASLTERVSKEGVPISLIPRRPTVGLGMRLESLCNKDYVHVLI